MKNQAEKHKQVVELEKQITRLGKNRQWLLTKLGISDQVFQNWFKRGIPARRLFDVASIAECEPEALKRGKIVPIGASPAVDTKLTGKRLESACTLSSEALDVALAYQEAPTSIKDHIRTILDDYIVSVAPVLKSLYSAARRPDQDRFNRMIEEAQRRDLARRKQNHN